MDPDAPVTVGVGIVATSVTAGTLSGLYGALNSSIRYPGVLAGSAAFSSGLASAVFFSVREYVISPVLLSTVSWEQYERRRHELEARRLSQPPPKERLTWSEMRSHKILDTTLSGALTGGLLNAWKRGARGILPGITTGALACALLQLGYNEIFVQRLKYISRRLKQKTSSDSDMSLAVSKETKTSPSLSANESGPSASEPSKSVGNRIIGLFGFSKISDDVYLERLRQERDAYVRKIRKLEAQIDEEERNSPSTA